jgi:hypothetical protein
MSSVEPSSGLHLSAGASQFLHALIELGYLSDEGLDRLMHRLAESVPDGEVDAVAMRRVAAVLLFEHPPADSEQASLLTAEWALLFG